MLTGVATGLIVAAIVAVVAWGLKWLRKDENRKRLRQAVCRHEWETLDLNRDGSDLVFITHHTETCRKCGALR